MEVQFFSAFRPSGPQLRIDRSAPTSAARDADAQIRLRRAAEGLQQRAEDVAMLASGWSTRRSSAPVLWSASMLGLSTEVTTSEVRSSAEVNATSTSFGPVNPSWSGSSSADPTVTGTYTGGADTTWTFTVTQVPILGLGPTRLAVTDSGGAAVATITIPSGGNGTVRTIADGLSVSFSAGSFSFGDEFTVDVSASQGTDLRVGAAMDGTGDASANFEAGTAVNAGSFELNGTSISVAAGESVQDVLDRVTASAAGVDASYDAAGDRVLLRSRTAGSAGTITLGADTSGFLAAVKLDDAVIVEGVDADADRPLAEVGRFGAVQAGTLTVNGLGVTFDPAIDSLRALLARVGTTGVDAELTTNDQVVLLLGRTPGGELTLSDGATGLLDALAISERSARGVVHKGLSAHRRGELADALAGLRADLQALWNDALVSPGLRSSIAGLFNQLTDNDRNTLRRVLGIGVEAGGLTFAETDRDAVLSALGSLDAASVRSLKRAVGVNGITATAQRTATEVGLRLRDVF
ncbi:MAG: hypothetical protein AB7O92_10280 [Acidimicrobiia bacterium]